MLKKTTFLKFLFSPCKISLVWVPYAACLFGWLIGVYFCFNHSVRFGPDATVLYLQTETGIYGDWHPPIVSATWKLARTFYENITGTKTDGCVMMSLFQITIFWSGIFSILIAGKSFWKRNEKTRHKTWLFVFIAMFLLTWLLCLDTEELVRNFSKDVLMLGTYLLATGILLNFPKRKITKIVAALVILCLLFYGTAVRHNAVFALFPLLLWLVWNLTPPAKRSVIILFFKSGILWFLIIAGIHYVNYHWLQALHLLPLQERFYADIFLLNERTNKYQLPPNTFGNDFSNLNEKLFHEKLCESIYVEGMFAKINRELPVPLFFTQNLIRILPHEQYLKTENKMEEIHLVGESDSILFHIVDESEIKNTFPKDYKILRKAWLERIFSQPVDYFKMKTLIFYRYCKNSRLFFMNINALTVLILDFIFLVLFTFSRKRLHSSFFPALMLAWSSFFYIIPLWIFLPDEISRYLYWFYAASFISWVSLCSQSKLFYAVVEVINKELET